MSEHDEFGGDHAVIFVQAVPRPTEWVVVCPTCGDSLDCPMGEEIDGSFFAGDEDGCPFVQCACGTVIEPKSVRTI